MAPQAERPARVALVTGALGGLGRAICATLDAADYRLALADLDPADTRAEAARYRDAVGLALDLRDEASIKACVTEAAARLGGLDLLVNNAGVALPKPALDVAWTEWDGVVDVNLKGAFFASCAFARYRCAHGGGGTIVNVGSTHGLVGIADRSVYGISKAGLMHMTRMLAIEWAPHDLRVNGVAPGTVLTPSREAILTDEAARERMRARIPLARFIAPADVAAAVAYLAGDAAASITGHTLVLDGGTTVW